MAPLYCRAAARRDRRKPAVNDLVVRAQSPRSSPRERDRVYEAVEAAAGVVSHQAHHASSTRSTLVCRP